MSYTEKWFYKLWSICTKEHHVDIGQHVSESYFMVCEIIHRKLKGYKTTMYVYVLYNFPISLCLKTFGYIKIFKAVISSGEIMSGLNFSVCIFF